MHTAGTVSKRREKHEGTLGHQGYEETHESDSDADCDVWNVRRYGKRKDRAEMTCKKGSVHERDR